MIGTLDDWAEDRERRFRRLLVVSGAVHGVALLLMVFAPMPTRTPSLPGVVSVDLVASLPGPPEAPPAPAPVARPKPKPPVPEKVALPDKPKAKPKPKPKPTPKMEARPKPKPKAKPAPKPAPKSAATEQEYDDFLDQLRRESGRSAAAASAPVAGGARGGSVRVSPAELAWIRRAKMHVTRAWMLAPGFRTERLETHIDVRLGPTGEVQSTRVRKRSGNPWFDESVERAIRKASPLPAPPKAAEWSFVFRPEDVL